MISKDIKEAKSTAALSLLKVQGVAQRLCGESAKRFEESSRDLWRQLVGFFDELEKAANEEGQK